MEVWRGRMMKARPTGSLLALVALALLAAACTPPGANLVNRAVSDVGPEGQQDWEVSSDADYCNVQPPNVDFENATFGFAQTENNNPWRIAQTESMRNAARENGVELIITDAQSSTPKQVSDIEDMVAQGADVLFVPPREEEGLAPALEAAREAGRPGRRFQERRRREPRYGDNRLPERQLQSRRGPERNGADHRSEPRPRRGL